MATTEERLAALEAKLAALTATTPTEYYTHQYSGEEIDAAVGRAVSGGALDTSVNNVSNQLGTFVRANLLDNWYFGRPVNQRGQTEYAGNGYTLDRWRAWDGASSIVTIGDDGARISGAVYQYQEVPVITAYAGKIVTLSILFADGALYTNTFALNESNWYNAQVNSHGIDRIELVFSTNFSDINNNFTRIVPLNVGVLSDPVLAVKLELGPTQTLAHREGDKWILNEVPEYGEQLRRCQRYALELIPPETTYCVLGSGKYLNSDGCVFVFIPTPVTFRTQPVVTGSGILRLVSTSNAGEGVIVDNARLRIDHSSNNGVSLACYPVAGSPLVDGQDYQLWLVNSLGSLILSADL